MSKKIGAMNDDMIWIADGFTPRSCLAFVKLGYEYEKSPQPLWPRALCFLRIDSFDGLRGFVAASCFDGAVFSVAEAFVGAVGGLGVGAPEVAVSGGVFFRREAGVDELAFGQEVAATFALHNFEFVLHGFILEGGFEYWTTSGCDARSCCESGF